MREESSAPNFARRARGHELLDDENLPVADLHRNLYELDVINRWLGGHAVTLAGLRSLLAGVPRQQHLTIVDVGCGGGDALRVVHHFLKKRGQPHRLIGLDLNPDCIAYAEQALQGQPNTEFIAANALHLPSLGLGADVVMSSLFTHHLFDQQLTQVLQAMHHSARLGMVVNDLHRHPLAWHSIKWLTRALSRSHLVQHDAPLSVARGFSRAEWQQALAAAGIDHYDLRWAWAFRWCLVSRHQPVAK